MRRTIRLLVVGVSWPLPTFVHSLLEGLATIDCEITVALSVSTASRIPKDTEMEFCRLGFGRAHWFRALLGFAKAVFSLSSVAKVVARWVRDNDLPRAGVVDWLKRGADLCSLLPWRWDIIYFPWNSGSIEYAHLYHIGVPVVLSNRGSQINVAPHNPERRSLREMLPSTFRMATTVHCVSNAILQESTRLGLDPHKAVVIHPSVNAGLFSPLTGTERIGTTFKVVSTGTLIWHKGFEYAIQAIRMLVDQGLEVTYDIIGEGPDRQRLEFAIHDLQLQGAARLLGKRTPEEISKLLWEADAYLLSSVTEGLSNAALEAMASGLPIVTTDCGGMREAIDHGVEGFVVPIRSPESMAGALLSLANDATLRRKMGQAGRARVLRDFTMERQLREWRKLVHEAIGKRKHADVSGKSSP